MNFAYPYQINLLNRTASADDAAYIRQLIEQVLFTAPGERVNRPDFGSGLLQLVFSSNSEELAAAQQFLLQGVLQKWLGDRIRLENVIVDSQEEILNIAVQYSLPTTQERRIERFEQVL